MAQVDVEGVVESDGDIGNRPLPPGEYNAEIMSCGLKKIQKEGSDYDGAWVLEFVAKAEGEEFSANVRHSIFLPFPKAMDAEQIRKSKAWLSKLQVACGMEVTNSIDDEAFMHQELRVVLGQKGKETDEYGIQNTLRDVLPL